MSSVDPEFQAMHERAQETLDYWMELARLGFSEEICKVSALKIDDLPEVLQEGKDYVDKLLTSSVTPDLRTMVKIARRLGCEFKIELVPIIKGERE